MISRALTRRAIDELAIRLAGATEFAIDEIVRRRGDAVKTGRRGRAAAASRGDSERRGAPDRLPGAARCRPSPAPSRPCRAPSRGSARATEIGASLADLVALVYAEVALVMAVAAAYDHDLDAHDDRAADVRVVLALDAGVARFGKHGVELADGKRLDPRDRELYEESEPRARCARHQAHGARARTHDARARDPVRHRRRDRRGRELQGDAPRGSHGAALLRLHREHHRHLARITVTRRTPAAQAPSLVSAREDRDHRSSCSPCSPEARWR